MGLLLENVFMSHPKKARLSWILVLEWRREACWALVDPVLFRIEAHEQYGQHRYEHLVADFGVSSVERSAALCLCESALRDLWHVPPSPLA